MIWSWGSTTVLPDASSSFFIVSSINCSVRLRSIASFAFEAADFAWNSAVDHGLLRRIEPILFPGPVRLKKGVVGRLDQVRHPDEGVGTFGLVESLLSLQTKILDGQESGPQFRGFHCRGLSPRRRPGAIPWRSLESGSRGPCRPGPRRALIPRDPTIQLAGPSDARWLDPDDPRPPWFGPRTLGHEPHSPLAIDVFSRSLAASGSASAFA